MLINASIAFGMLFILIVPLYIAGNTSAKNKIKALSDRSQQLAITKNFHIEDLVVVGNKAFAFSSEAKVLILFKSNSAEDYLLLDKAEIRFFDVQELGGLSNPSEIKFVYKELGERQEFLLYKEHRDSPKDIDRLRKISAQLKQLFN